MREGLACGTLCAAVGVLYVASDDVRVMKEALASEMMTWFKTRFGAWNCAELLEGDETRKMTLCPVIVGDTYLKLREMLEDAGTLP
jgi:hypothetical protein